MNSSSSSSTAKPVGRVPRDFVVSSSSSSSNWTKRKQSDSSSLSGQFTPTLKLRFKKLRRTGSSSRRSSPPRRKIPPAVSLPPRSQPIQQNPQGYFFPQTQPLSPKRQHSISQKQAQPKRPIQRHYVNSDFVHQKPAYQQAHIHSPKQRFTGPTQPTILEHPPNIDHVGDNNPTPPRNPRPNVRTELLRKNSSIRRTYSRQLPVRKNSVEQFRATPTVAGIDNTTATTQKLPSRSSSLRRMNSAAGSKNTPPGSPAKYNFTKLQLRRKLSFEVKESPNKVSKYEVKKVQLLNLKPKIRRFREQTPEETGVGGSNPQSEKPLASLKNTSYLLREHDAIQHAKDKDESGIVGPYSSSGDSAKSIQDFREFDFDYRSKEATSEEEPRVPIEPAKAQVEEHVSKEPAAPTPVINPPPASPPQATALERDSSVLYRPKDDSYYYERPEAGQFSRKRTLSTRRKPSRRGSQRLPLITRVDFYDNPNPAVDLETGRAVERRNSKKEDKETDLQVNEALAFVDTWSSYLRRAVAVRVVLRQEIHSLEEQEEEEWRNSQQQRTSLSSSDNDSLYSSASTMTSATSASSLVSSPTTRSPSPSSEMPSRASSQLEKSDYNNHHRSEFYREIDFTDDDESLDMSSSAHGEEQTAYSRRLSTYSPDKLKRLSEIRQSLDQGDIQKKYSSLIRPQSVQSEIMPQAGSSDSQWSTIAPQRRSTSDLPYYRSSSDSLTSIMRPGKESAWLKPKATKSVRPLPTVPGGRTDSRISSVPEKMRPVSSAAIPDYTTPVLHEQRSMSDKILKDMYQELEELQHRSAQLSDLVKSKRDSGISTDSDPLPSLNPPQQKESNESMEAHVSESTGSGSGSGAPGLQRGGVNRRRTPRSKFLRESRMSIDTSWKPSYHEADTESIQSSSQDSGITFDDPTTEWRSSVGKHPLLIEVGDASRPPSASETRFI
ncbi:hypothetical protein TRICI_005501 [Trichomonascus ciferrii]|uniref:Uncharacterized protein n=1 Tax=Trichomonascus ciferrii TaxID=44093 RepID=A0A642USA8_9ASCO|nr:hypothetical protein TRICI_005501 [Trichomonascus ciferrii]